MPSVTSSREALQAGKVIVLLGKLSEGRSQQAAAQQEFKLVRDFLQAEILIDNAHTPGVIANLTLGESMITRLLTHIDQPLSFSATIFIDGLKCTLRKLDPKLRNPMMDQSHLSSLHFNDNGMTSSQVAKCVKSVFKKAESVVLPSATIMRKSAVTNACDNASHISGDLADLMLHQEKTADKHYKLQKKSKVAVSASKELGQLIRKKMSVTVQETKENAKTADSTYEISILGEEKLPT